MFDEFMTDKIIIKKENGDLIKDLKASVQESKIFLNHSDVVIEDHDLIQQVLSNGTTKVFKVLDAGFQESFSAIDAHYQMKVKKLDLKTEIWQ